MSRAWIRVAVTMFAVGWGANQFTPLLLVYREYTPGAEVSALFGVYAIGLIPALLVAGPLSDKLGRRPIMLPVFVLSGLASVVLMVGAHDFGLLLSGRLLAGVASGAAFGPGTAWIKELSSDAPPGSGARRAAVSLSAGFAIGPFLAGILAQWLPYPETLPYVMHILLVIAIAPFTWIAPETVREPSATVRVLKTELWVTLKNPVFLRKILPSAPWVFGAVTTALVVLPGLVSVGQFGVVVSGVSAGLTLGTGVLVQPLAHRLERRGAGLPLHVGIGCLIAGLLLASLTAWTRQPFLLIICALILGSAYGMLLTAGLTMVECLAAPDDLATVTAVFYCLTYVGFSLPWTVSQLAVLASPGWILAGAATTALLTWPIMLRVPPGRTS